MEKLRDLTVSIFSRRKDNGFHENISEKRRINRELTKDEGAKWKRPKSKKMMMVKEKNEGIACN